MKIQFPLEQQKIRPPRQLAQLSGWTKYFRHRDTIKLFRTKWIQRLLSPINDLWKDLILY